MHNLVTVMASLAARDAPPPAAGAVGSSSPAPFAPLFTRPVRVVIAAVDDELGRPLAGVFVPDGELL